MAEEQMTDARANEDSHVSAKSLTITATLADFCGVQILTYFGKLGGGQGVPRDEEVRLLGLADNPVVHAPTISNASFKFKQHTIRLQQ
jgi:hypothetical protein